MAEMIVVFDNQFRVRNQQIGCAEEWMVIGTGCHWCEVLVDLPHLVVVRCVALRGAREEGFELFAEVRVFLCSVQVLVEDCVSP